MSDSDKIEAVLTLALRFGSIGGDHHRVWLLDQMVRVMTGDGYDAWVVAAKVGEDGPETYSWDEGTAP